MSAPSSSGARSSRTVSTLSAAFERSRTAGGVRTIRSWSENAWLLAFASVCLRRVAGIAPRWIGGSALCVAVSGLIDRTHTTLLGWVRGSRGYRWLTAEPDPDVIVIDLRETWTVGPLIAVLNRLIVGIDRSTASSTAVSIGRRAIGRTLAAPIRTAGVVTLAVSVLLAVAAIAAGRMSRLLVALAVFVVGGVALFETRSWEELRETRVGSLLVSVFVPPDPPESADNSARVATDSDGKAHTDADASDDTESDLGGH